MGVETRDRRPESALARWFPMGTRDEAALDEVVDRLTVDREQRPRFLLLLFLSVVVATFGLIANSTAVVIGAMLLAPLMTPVLGFAIGLTTLQGARMIAAAALVVVSSLGAVVLAWSLASIMPLADAQLVLPAEVLARTRPTTADLFIALAAGVAGAVATIRHDISDALPGVAVAVALVPPLSSIGITLADGESTLAWGAFLLYVTNLVAIAAAAALAFVLAGLIPDLTAPGVGRRLATSLVLTLAGLAVIWIPLRAGLEEIVAEADAVDAIDRSLDEWLGPEQRETTTVLGVQSLDENVVIAVSGPDEPPPVSELADLVSRELGSGVTVELRWIPQTSTMAVTTGE